MKIGQMEKVPFGSENLGKLQGILCEGLAISKKEQQISQSYQALRGSENVKNFCTQTFQLLPRQNRTQVLFRKCIPKRFSISRLTNHFNAKNQM